jgi:hypothetical protein
MVGLAEAGAGHVRIYGGGGGVIVPDEIARLAAAGVRIFSPEDGQRLGLPGMINQVSRNCDTDLADSRAPSGDNVFAVLMDAARVCTLQQITDAFFVVRTALGRLTRDGTKSHARQQQVRCPVAAGPVLCAAVEKFGCALREVSSGGRRPA